MVVRLLDLDPMEIALLGKLVEADIVRTDLDLAEIDMMQHLEDRGIVEERPDLVTFTLTPAGQELAVKASLTFGNPKN